MAKISWQDIAKDSTGFSSSVAGVGAGVKRKPPKLEVNDAKRLLTDLENRRVLYNDFIIETYEQVVSSVQAMRRHLGQMLQEIDLDSKLAKIASEMQAACRTFLNADQRHRPRSPAYLGPAPRSDSQWFTALEAFRVQLGRCVARLAVEYHLDVEGELVSMLALGAPADHTGAPPDDVR